MLKTHNRKIYTIIFLVNILILPIKSNAQNQPSKGMSTRQSIISPVPMKKQIKNIIKSTKQPSTSLAISNKIEESTFLKDTSEKYKAVNKNFSIKKTASSKPNIKGEILNNKTKKIVLKTLKVKNFDIFLSISDEKEYSIAFTIIQAKNV